ncbi:hypothetical protein AXI59_14680 [Bacillus nakamurai]|uniref:N-acetyltransferase domain-containing protein n=1 Tax=Bacillus nakamurai TaxID=1793963 RepID=A0A150F4Y5_9BACI|nr:hypothetical protein [Bacillus nakamurai]KXZ17250.1 hypothetical protein AXI58_01270 [Bacillus nakamurai]KXZ20693.1 hypothetical protein AXI59_14680 [Bacillus nakamurai]MED1229001.1 hypothetical protein [Bacillus nakamurai]
MFYQLRVARDKDTEALETFLRQADTAHAEIDQSVSRFIMLEDSEKQIAACLGIEKVSGGKGLLRSLVMSDRLNQSHIVTLFQSMEVLCEKHQIKDVYLVANQISSAEFLNVMGFETCGEMPEELYASEHFRDSLRTKGSFLMVKTSA